MFKKSTFSRVLMLLLAVLLLIAPMAVAQEVPIEPEGAVALDTLDGQLLVALQDPLYNAAYAYLAEGNKIKNGTKGDPAKGLQQIISDLGVNVKVDGAIGKKTMTALNEAIAGFTDT